MVCVCVCFTWMHSVCWLNNIICGRRTITCGEPKFPHAWSVSSSVRSGALTAPLGLWDHAVSRPACLGMSYCMKHFIEQLCLLKEPMIDWEPQLNVSPPPSSLSAPLLSPGMKGTGTPPPPPLEKQHVHHHHKPYSHYHHHQSASDGKMDPHTSSSIFRENLFVRQVTGLMRLVFVFVWPLMNTPCRVCCTQQTHIKGLKDRKSSFRAPSFVRVFLGQRESERDWSHWDRVGETTCRKPFPCAELANKMLAHVFSCLSAPEHGRLSCQSWAFL